MIRARAVATPGRARQAGRTPAVSPRDGLASGADAARDSFPSRADLPRHVAIIMDGNRRWARSRGLAEAEGHAAGVESIRPIVRQAVRRDIEVLSIYAFSRENWSRSSDEVATLFALLESAIRDETDELRAQGARVRVLGRLAELPETTRHSIGEAVSATADGDRLVLNVAFNYSSRQEIVDAVRQCVADGLDADEIDEAAIDSRLYTAGLPEVDLLIRTGGEQRISNFLLWQAQYAELYFCDAFWPDFGPEAFDAALLEYARRHRRFGR
ncbi:MAG TPA: polyprenyl diphosphate synthase [Candidatus Limnocylindrales bacterium]|nr:polyprenyl diphosphate synthase [Candidatus Limnocylindrales bacterium]